MEQLKDKTVLVPFADWPQHGGQPVVQRAEPAELVEPSHEIAVPGNEPGVGERGASSRVSLLGGCWRIVGLVAACWHKVPPWGVRLWLDSDENLLVLRSFCLSVISLQMPRGNRLRHPARRH